MMGFMFYGWSWPRIRNSPHKPSTRPTVAQWPKMTVGSTNRSWSASNLHQQPHFPFPTFIPRNVDEHHDEHHPPSRPRLDSQVLQINGVQCAVWSVYIHAYWVGVSWNKVHSENHFILSFKIWLILWLALWGEENSGIHLMHKMEIMK